MKKALSIIMAAVIALSVCLVMTSASNSGESFIGENFVLTTGADKSTASTFAMGETVYGKVEGSDVKCYALYIDEAKEIDISFRANSEIEVVIEKSDGSETVVLKGDKSYDKHLALSNAHYYITIKNYVEPVEETTTGVEETTAADETTTAADETTTAAGETTTAAGETTTAAEETTTAAEETTTAAEETTTAAGEEETTVTTDFDISGMSVGAVEAEDASAEYYFRASCESMPELLANINHKSAELVAGESLQLKLSDITVENINYFWRVYDDPETKVDENEIATVTPDGLVTVKMNNSFFTQDTEIQIHAVMYYNNQEIGKVCTIKAVIANIFLDPYHDTSEQYSLHLGVGAYRSIIATTNVEDKNIVWSSSDENVATVSPSGKITATGIGQATVKATLEGTNLSRSILVKVADGYTSVMGVYFGSHSATVRAKEDVVLEYGFKTAPEGDVTPSNSKVIFTSSNPEIATVDVDGKVTGVSEGTATITVTTEDGGYTDECKVTVTAAIPNWLMVIIAPIRLIYNLILLIIGG